MIQFVYTVPLLHISKILDWIYLAKGRGHLQAVMNTAMNLQVL
jgi:hypothetical protein